MEFKSVDIEFIAYNTLVNWGKMLGVGKMKDISEMLMRTRIEKSIKDFEKLKTRWLIKDYEKEMMKSKQEAMNLQHKLAIQRKEEMAARAREAKAKQDALGGEVDCEWNNSKGSRFVKDVVTKAVELGLNKILTHVWKKLEDD
nr:hypothetical protein [Tanacetum cinerariifolium]